MITFEQITQPSGEVVTLAEVKNHLRIDHNLDDVRIGLYMEAAISRCEKMLHRRLRAQTVQVAYDRVGYINVLPDVAPIREIQAVEYKSLTGWVSLSASDYETTSGEFKDVLIDEELVGTIRTEQFDLKHGSERLRIIADVGYETPADVPAPIKAWLLLAIGEMYENAEASAETEVKRHSFVDNLIAPFVAPQWH